MKLSNYGYDFNADMLAKYPSEERDESRLMVVNRATGEIEHRQFKNIIEYFDEKDLFVFNDTKVFPARLYGNKEKTGAEIEIFLLRELNEELRLWDVLVDPARKIRIGIIRTIKSNYPNTTPTIPAISVYNIVFNYYIPTAFKRLCSYNITLVNI